MTTPQQETRPPARHASLALAIAVALSLAACGGGAGKEARADDDHKPAAAAAEHKDEEHAESDELKLTADEAQRAGVKVEEIKPEVIADTVVATATIRADADRLARVAPRIEGRITSAPAKLGERVRAGQLLATLDSVEVGEAHAAWVQARSELRIAESDFKRAEQLSAEEIIPRKDFLRAQADREKAASALRAASDRLKLLGGSADSQGSAVSTFAVNAPFAGTVVEKKATLGELGSPSEPLFTVADLGKVWIVADLPEVALAKVRVGAQAKVSVPAYPGETFNGRVDHIGAALDKDTRTVSARIVVANADGRLKPEMFATATIEAPPGSAAAPARQAMSVPDAAIVLLQGQPTVFVRDEHGGYEPRAVQPGDRSGGRTVISAGVKAGEQVVTAGAYELKARKLKSQLGHGH